MSGIELRPHTPGDAAALEALWVASWNATLPEIDFATRRTWFRDWLGTHLAVGAVVLCAWGEDGRIVGFLGIDPGNGHMEQIAVHPDAFGGGVGDALLRAAKALCPAGITLRVNQDNPRAISFYRRAGFVVTGEGVNPGGSLKVLDMAWIHPSAG